MKNPNFNTEIQEIISEFELINQTREDILNFLEKLEKNGMSNPNIEKYLTGYLLIIFFAETETKLKKILAVHSKNFEKENFSKFLTSKQTSMNILRSVKKHELEKTFKSIKFNKQSRVKYNALLSNRHNLAHEGVFNATLTDFEEWDINSVAKEFITAIQEHLDE